MTIELILPTIESVESYGLNRYPKGYDTIRNNNPFLRLYEAEGKDRDVNNSGLNEVLLSFYKFRPRYVTVQQQKDNTRVTTEPNQRPLVVAKFHISLENKELEFVHSHTWKKPEKPAGVAMSLINGIFGGNTVKAVQNIAEAATEGTNVVNQVLGLSGNTPTPQLKEDTMHLYSESSPADITLNFNLFTKDNFYRDIFEPIQLLTALSYPTRIENIENPGGTGGINEVIAEAQRAIAEASNTVRVSSKLHLADAPCLCDVSHKSRLYNLSGLYIQTLKYQFNEPWYNGYFAGTTSNNYDKKLQYLKGSYPTSCKVTLTLSHSRMMFADDILAQTKSFLDNQMDDMIIKVNDKAPDFMSKSQTIERQEVISQERANFERSRSDLNNKLTTWNARRENE